MKCMNFVVSSVNHRIFRVSTLILNHISFAMQRLIGSQDIQKGGWGGIFGLSYLFDSPNELLNEFILKKLKSVLW